MSLFLQLQEAAHHSPDPQNAAPKAGFNTAAHQQSQTKCQEVQPPELILPTHKNTPCTQCMQGV